MMRPGFAQTLFVAAEDVRSGQNPYDGCTGCHSGLNAKYAVLNDNGSRGFNAHFFGGMQVDVGMRLPSLHARSAENSVLKTLRQTYDLQGGGQISSELCDAMRWGVKAKALM